MDLSSIYQNFSHTKIFKHNYLNFNKGGKMSKIKIAFIAALLNLTAISYASASCSNWDCSPLNWDNSSLNWDNSSLNWDNSPLNWDNSSLNFNRNNGIYDNYGNSLGYTSNGNIFSDSGIRLGYFD